MSSQPKPSTPPSARVSRSRVRLVALLIVLAVTSMAKGQCAARWFPGEGIAGVNGAIYGAAALPQGDVIAVGAFTLAGAESASNIARWSAATGRWSAIGFGLNAPAFAIVALPDGDLIVGGQFSASGSTPLAGVGRLNPASGHWTPLGSGVSGGDVYALALGPASEVYLAGSFSAAGGVNAAGVARWSLLASQWSSLGAPSNRGPHAIAVDQAGNVYVATTFMISGSGNANGIARRVGATLEWESLGQGVLGGDVSAITVLPSGLVAVGGNFNIAGGQSAAGIALWNPTTRAWSTLGSGIAGGAGNVDAILALNGNDLLVSGNFLTAGGVSAPYLARWHASTSAWSAVGPTGSGLNGPGLALVPIPAGPYAGQILVAGGFSSTGQPPLALGAANIARLNPATSTWAALGSGLDGVVNAIAPMPAGPVLVGGSFSRAGAFAVANVALWTPASNSWKPLGAGVNGVVNAVAAAPTGDAIVAGQFTAAYTETGSSIPANRIARWNPTTQTWSALGSGIGGVTGSRVLALAVLPGGDIVAAGGFTLAGGAPAVSIARWTEATSSWSTMGTGMDDLVYALAALPNGDIVAGGEFTSAGGVPVSGLARWSSASHTWSSLGTGTNGPVYALALRSLSGSNQLVVGGNFTLAGGVPANSISFWNADTAAWAGLGAFGGGVEPTIRALAIADPAHPGDVVVGGTFDVAGGAPAHHLARWNATTHAWTPLGAGTDASVNAVAVLARRDVLAGGPFSAAGGNVSIGFARWSEAPACPADFDCSGALAIEDLFAYINAFLAADPAADTSGDNILDVGDLLEFISIWFHGC